VTAATRTTIRLSGVATDDLAPVYWAMKNGAYEKAGLSVEFTPSTSGTAAATAVIAGAYDIGKGSMIAGCAAFLKDVPIRFVGNGVLWETNNPWSLGLVAADSKIKTGADLNGQTVGVAALNDLSVLAIAAWVDANGGDSKTIKWVEIPNSAAGAAVGAHRIAACQLNEPQLQAAISGGQVRVLAPFLGAISPSYVLTNYFLRPDWAAKNRSAAEQFMRTTYEAAAFTNTHPADTAPLVADITKIPVEVIAKMTRAHVATSSDPALIQPAIDTAAKYQFISRRFDAKEIYLSA
jgi:NitT/TauT family transport system substrate-binding protein